MAEGMVHEAIPVIIIFAPTACGKTACVRQMFGTGSLSCFKGTGEVVSADSQSVYRGMDIGTAKPTPQECVEIPHHVINLVDPDSQFGIGEWYDEADKACAEIWQRKKIPVVTGGSGFYIRNFILGLTVAPQGTPEIREMVQQKMNEEGPLQLYQELRRVDPLRAEQINMHDEYRIRRALEIFYTCGKPLSSFPLPSQPRSKYSFCTMILTREKEDLYHRIDERVDQMFAQGLEQEVRQLMLKGYGKDSPGMKAIGYHEFFLGKSSAQTREQIKFDSRHYAKKQYTFMRDIPDAVTIPADDTSSIARIAGRFLSDCNIIPKKSDFSC